MINISQFCGFEQNVSITFYDESEGSWKETIIILYQNCRSSIPIENDWDND